MVVSKKNSVIKQLLYLTVGCLVILGLYLLLLQGQETSSESQPVSLQSPDLIGEVVETDNDKGKDKAKILPQTSIVEKSRLARVHISTDDDVLSDYEIELQEWRDQAGYLSIELTREYYRMPLQELKEIAESGGVAAAYKLGWRLAKEGKSEEALYFFKEAILGGSLAAALDLSWAYLERNGPRFEYDPIQGYIWRRVAEAMGAGFGPSMLFGPVQFENREDRIMATMLYHMTIAELQATHYERYGVPLPFYPIEL